MGDTAPDTPPGQGAGTPLALEGVPPLVSAPPSWGLDGQERATTAQSLSIPSGATSDEDDGPKQCDDVARPADGSGYGGGGGGRGEGEGGEGGSANMETLPIENRLAFMRGHVEAGLALYRAGAPEEAGKHLLHPHRCSE